MQIRIVTFLAVIFLFSFLNYFLKLNYQSVPSYYCLVLSTKEGVKFISCG